MADDWDRDRIKALMDAAGMSYGGVPAGAANLDLNFALPQSDADAAAALVARGAPPPDPTIYGAPPPTVIPGPAPQIAGVPQGWPGGPPPKPSADQFLSSVDSALGGKVGLPSPNLPPPSPPQDDQVTFAQPGGGGMVGPQYVNIPGHDMPLVSPETRALVDAGPRAELGAVNAQAGADQAKVDASQQIAMARAAAYDRLVQQQQQREQQRQAVLRQQENDMDRVSDQVSRTMIDPDHLWSTKNAAQKIAGFVAAMAGGYLAGKHGGPNQYLESLDKEIDRDIAAQKANYEIKKGKLTDLRSVYAQKMQRFGDERAAEAAAKNDMLAAVMARGDAIAANADSEQVNANWSKGKAVIAKQVAGNATAYSKWVPPQSVQIPGAGGYGQAGTVDGTPIYVGGGKYIIPKNNVGPDLAKRVAAAASMDDKLSQLANLYKQRGTGDKVFQTDLADKIDRLQADVDTDYTVLKGQGAMSEGDKAVTDKALGQLKGWRNLSGDPSALVKDAQRSARNANTQAVQTIGGGTVYQKATITRDKNGELKQQWVPIGEYGQDQGASGPVDFKAR